MPLPFREHHILCLLKEYEKQRLPLDLFISHYFRAHKALGSKDRGFIADTVYEIIRWKGLIDYLCKDAPTWEKCLSIYLNEDLKKHQQNEEIPYHIRFSFPKILFDLIVKSHGLEKGIELCQISNSPAPTTVRINPLKTTREKMLQKWQSHYFVSPCKFSENGINFHKKINFFSLPEFKEGLFEVQDEGSQLLANLIKAIPGQKVLDYCAGSGGKTLAFAPRLELRGQIFLHDIRDFILQEARKRLKRAGIQNAQVIRAHEFSKLKKLKKKMDWILVDVPCSGTGTLRRNPDMKWKFTEEMLHRLLGQQRVIFEKALSFLQPQGRIVYATCSMLKEENQQQIDHFIETYGLKIEGTFFQTLPTESGMDGFFGATLFKDF